MRLSAAWAGDVMRSFKSFFLINYLIVAALFNCIALKTEAQSPVRYVIGVENIDYTPYFRGNWGDYGGFARELFDAFALDTGVSVEYRPLPILRLYSELFAGGIDGKFPDSPRWNASERVGKALHYSAPIVGYVDGVAVLPEHVGFGLDKINRLAVVRGFDPFDWRDRIESGRTRLILQRDFRTLLELVVNGEADAAFGNQAVIAYHLRETLKTPGALLFDKALPHSSGQYFLTSLRRPQLIIDFDKWIYTHGDVVRKMKLSFSLEDNG